MHDRQHSLFSHFYVICKFLLCRNTWLTSAVHAANPAQAFYIDGLHPCVRLATLCDPLNGRSLLPTLHVAYCNFNVWMKPLCEHFYFISYQWMSLLLRGSIMWTMWICTPPSATLYLLFGLLGCYVLFLALWCWKVCFCACFSLLSHRHQSLLLWDSFVHTSWMCTPPSATLYVLCGLLGKYELSWAFMLYTCFMPFSCYSTCFPDGGFLLLLPGFDLLTCVDGSMPSAAQGNGRSAFGMQQHFDIYIHFMCICPDLHIEISQGVFDISL